jgi:NIPSNAP protein
MRHDDAGRLAEIGARTRLARRRREAVTVAELSHQPFGRITMTIYEMRTYTLHIGKMAEAVKLYTELGYPALQKGGQDKKLIGYFQADTGMVNQLVHLWKFDDDADRRAHWAAVFANKDFVEGFASKFRPLLVSQEVKLLTAAPWGPHP